MAQEQQKPDPDDSRKPDSPTDLTKPTLVYTLKKTLREFTGDQCTDLAASLTYYTVLALFPGLLAIVSILGLVSDPQKTIDSLLTIIGNVGSQSVVDLLKDPIEGLVRSPAAGITFVVGIVGAIWSASGYVGAFGRAMNRIYNVREGRPIWKLRPTMLGVTVFTVVMLVVGLLVLVSGPLARSFGDVIGLGDAAATVLLIVQWPILLVVAIIVVAVLYYWAPNVKQPKFRWVSGGSILAILILIIASVGFGFYVANFSNYNATYGSLGGVIVFLLWLWITNNALLFGAEFDAELERGRQLQAGIRAEEDIQLPERDTRQIEKQDEKRAQDVLEGIRIRQGADGD
ncbi:membrane protein [Curtobacterium sp. PhB172]|uniref:YihY/virulence factor BrkB family protein n=1 Tax=unclassified Curtobacterium TaxID=257496 RepID=UPI000F469FF2|nr:MULTISPECIES: YihY/virulence factor BrkB family protein [unclassified Curtobacterium]ROQ17758.1 membrane protein [Curtobacterium sp. PhB171]ROQ28997.1 membrane protein [Curtobacterium sp. PhB170]ROS45859.1 membrane protein [Curtobacterium sp. PhB131]ROS65412.1 membrane protein [Curtobacterium sp. PhB172]ROS67839.1 membrane protein [Curtobacterium sp. PhB141]